MEDKDKDLYVPFVISNNGEEDNMSENFFKHKRHFFIFTFAGKPVFTRYGDEIKLSSFFASLSTMVQKMAIYYSQDK